ncbi:hypothetical protein LTR66_015146 [Elasticomyces elasticus]|nr:hypothetical protein LTR66_015146 [Elasticomyces elasticus]
MSSSIRSTLFSRLALQVYPTTPRRTSKAYTDLDADVDIDPNDWKEEGDEPLDNGQDEDVVAGNAAHNDTIVLDSDDSNDNPAVVNETMNLDVQPLSSTFVPAQPRGIVEASRSGSLLSRRQQQTSATVNSPDSIPSSGIAMPPRPSEVDLQNHLDQQRTQLETPGADQIIAGEGPLTPRNNAGPFVFDGSGSRSNGGIGRGFRSLDDASDEIE